MVEVIDMTQESMSGSVDFEKLFEDKKWNGINVKLTSLPAMNINVLINIYGIKP